MKQTFRFVGAAATAIGLALASSAVAQTTMIEQFAYSTGNLPTASAAVWAAQTTGAGTNTPQVTASSLSYSGMTNVTGGAVSFTTSGEDDFRGGFSITTASLTTAYYSAVINLA